MATQKKTMKAAVMYDYGGSDVLRYEDAQIPAVGPEEVLVKIEYTSVNPYDWKVREGNNKQFITLKFPAIIGIDVAGKVENVGSAVKSLKVGDRVFGRADFTKSGSYAEYASVNEKSLATLPSSVSSRDAAALPVVAGTAITALFDVAKLRSGQRILITGASGGVGSAAVQIAKSVGAYVIGTTSKPNMNTVKSLGADEVIDYTDGDFTKKMKQPVDVVFDTVGGDTTTKSYGIVKKGGILVMSANRPDEALAAKYGIIAKAFQAATDSKRLSDIASMVESGKLKPLIEREFKLSEIREAHDLSQSGRAKGKIIIKVS